MLNWCPNVQKYFFLQILIFNWIRLLDRITDQALFFLKEKVTSWLRVVHLGSSRYNTWRAKENMVYQIVRNSHYDGSPTIPTPKFCDIALLRMLTELIVQPKFVHLSGQTQTIFVKWSLNGYLTTTTIYGTSIRTCTIKIWFFQLVK